MTATAQAQFLTIIGPRGPLWRWQSRWLQQTVTVDETLWSWQQFEADGIVNGDVSSEGSLAVRVPSTYQTQRILRTALRYGHLLELQQYEFDPQLGRDAPPAAMALVASYIGEVVGLSGFRTLEVEVGSALAPIGVQFPPRSMTTQLIGVPCQL
jgi:hypothetical protein